MRGGMGLPGCRGRRAEQVDLRALAGCPAAVRRGDRRVDQASTEHLAACGGGCEPELGPDFVDLLRQRSGDGHRLLEPGDVGPFGGGDLPLRVGRCLINERAEFLPVRMVLGRDRKGVEAGGGGAGISILSEIPADGGKSRALGCSGSKLDTGKG
jgi:hypothetical protein